MSIKDLFNKGHSLKLLKNQSQDTLREDLESSRYVSAYSAKRQRFFPDVDFTTASNFARFGLAEEYYDTAIKRIYQTYPYDGSQAEKIEWENDGTYLDLFLFENEYPRTNGFVSFNSVTNTHTTTAGATAHYSSSSPQYIKFYGGPHADPRGDYKSATAPGQSRTGVSKANIFNTASLRANNLEINLDNGVTVEFWMKKEGWEDESSNSYEYIFDNFATGSAATARFKLFTVGATSTSHLYLTIVSGSTYAAENMGLHAGVSDIADGVWRHYAVSAKNDINANKAVVDLYVNGEHRDRGTGTIINPIMGTMVAGLGAIPSHDGTNGPGYANIISSSFDEFRYWKTQRNAQQIGRYFKDQIGGGTNTDNVKYDDVSNKVDLGVYFKFNEGITGVDTTDSIVLDYSGRISNGTLVNYSSDCRNTGSAMVLATAATREFKDPILYSTHPDVSSLLTSKKDMGRMHDYNNSVSLYKSVPAWILEEDERESGHLKYLMQILASYFDDLYLQIEKLSKLKDINYPDDNSYEKPLPFADRLLETRGYDAPELFAHASALAKFLERSERKLFEKKLYEVKNIIYQNIYNNLSYIQKSKGTFKSLRNFLRCFGVDEELIKLNIYANNDVYEFKDNFTNTALRKKYIDFDDAETRLASPTTSHENSFTATAYQYKNPYQDNTISYIPGIATSSMTGAAMTIEAEVILPKRSLTNDPNYQLFPSLSSSIFGLHAVSPSDSDFTYAVDDTINFNIVVGKDSLDRRNGNFSLITAGASDILNEKSSNKYIGLYDNQKWNLAFRLRPTKYPFSSQVDGAHDDSEGNESYTYELYGVNSLSNIINEEFTVTGTLSTQDATKFFTEPKRLFAGAHRTNFTGSVVQHSDVKVSSIRAWYSYLDDEAMRAHARDSNTYGALHPLKNANLTDQVNFLGTKVPQIKTLALNWNMDNVTGSDASGRFFIDDFTSGSADTASYGPVLTPVIEKNYTARGDFFTSDADLRTQAVDVEFVQTAKQKLPEVVNSDDMVKILNKQDDMVFTRDTTYIQHLLSVEKSMYQTISEEMMRFFASVVDFNNLVGEPINRYRPHYKKLEKIRELFFDRVGSDLDLEKFIEYYKWIDNAITMMVSQLIPASSNTVEALRNMVESHVLERNKYWTKFSTLEVNPPNPISSLKAIEELKYNWKFGHAPVGANQATSQDQSCLWWKQRADREGVLSSGDASVDSDKASILHAAITEVTGTGPKLKTYSGTRYSRSYYYNRSLARPVDFSSKRQLSLKAGSNPQENKRHDLYKSIIKWGSDDDFIFINADLVIPGAVCDDEQLPEENNKKPFRVKTLSMRANETIGSNAQGTGYNDLNYDDAKSTLLLPFSMYSCSINTGYRATYVDPVPTPEPDIFGGGMPLIEFANMHDDKYGLDAEIPMQGPFTEKHVGGLQHRHVGLNRHNASINSTTINNLDDPSTRPEGWHLQAYLDQDELEYIFRELFVNATTAATTDTSILLLPSDSADGEPSPYEYWRNGVEADNSWSFLKGPTPSAGTGPGGTTHANSTYAYCEVLPSKVGQTFSLVTPLIDLTEVAEGDVKFRFNYHMHGLHMGNLKVQASQDPNFIVGVEDLMVTWDTDGDFGGPTRSAVVSGQQQTNQTDDFASAEVGTVTNGSHLAKWLGKRFYIRFLYTAGISHLGDCTITEVRIFKHTQYSGVRQNSFKLFNPTYDNHHRPSAIYTRQQYAKRPVNIRNIHMTGSSPTIAGNYLNRYEYVSTNSPEANDPFFVKNIDQIGATKAELIRHGKIEDLLSQPPGTLRTSLGYVDYTLPDRSFLTGSVKNRTRIMTKFSSPGGFEVMSRGFLDPAHETYSAYNATTFRNLSSRTIYNSQLTAHMGKFGVSTHGYGSPVSSRPSGNTKAIATIAATSAFSNGQTLKLIDAQGNIVTYKVDTGNSHVDGRLHSDEASINVGTSGTSTGTGVIQRLRDAINNTNENLSNGLTMNVTLVYSVIFGTVGQIVITQDLYGQEGNTPIVNELSNTSLPLGTSFVGGSATARVYGINNMVEQVGTEWANDFSITGQAAAHRYHRNNVERPTYIGDAPESANVTYLTASVRDNAFVSHMIPRTDNQTRWITGSLI